MNDQTSHTTRPHHATSTRITTPSSSEAPRRKIVTNQPVTLATLTKDSELVAQPAKHLKGEKMKHFQYLAMVALFMLLAACGQTQAPEAAPTEETPPVEGAAPTETTLQPTAAYADIVGTARLTNSNVSPGGLRVYLDYWDVNRRQWFTLGHVATTSSRIGQAGRFVIPRMPTGYYYNIRVSHQSQNRICTAVFQGESGYFRHRYTQNWPTLWVTVNRIGNCPF